MKGFMVITLILLVQRQCSSRPQPEGESVVSVYTTLPTATNTSLDVYHQIATNLAERITMPFYRFFGFNASQEKTTRRPFDHIELQNNPPSPDIGVDDKTNYKPLTNDITPDRDVEEISAEAAKKSDKKPEKITLFSTYLPAVSQNLETPKNDTSLELDDVDNDIDLDDDEEAPRSNSFVYFLELMGSIIQLLWGGFLSLFKPSTSSS